MNNWIFWILLAISTTLIYIIGQYGQVPEAFPWISIQAKQIIGHILLYLSLGMLIARYLSGAFRLRSILLILIVVDVRALFGIYDEFHQGYVKGRGVEAFDVLVDMTGGLLGSLVVVVFDKLKRPVDPDFQDEDSLQTRVIRQVLIAVHIYVFVCIPAAVYSQNIATYVAGLRSQLPSQAYELVRNHKPGRTIDQVPAPDLMKLTDGGLANMKHGHGIGLSVTYDEALSDFAKIANMLQKRREEQIRMTSTSLMNKHSSDLQLQE